MPQLNHTIVHSKNQRESAAFLTELLGLPAPKPFGPFLVVDVDNQLSLDFIEVPSGQHIDPQHYAFLVTEREFDAIFERIRARALPFWADPRRRRARSVLGRSQWTLPRDLDATLRQRPGLNVELALQEAPHAVVAREL
jgi:hypothetical protein